MSRKSLLLGLLVSFLLSSVAIASPVRLPSDSGQTKAVFGGDEAGWLMGIGAEYDHMDKMKFKESTEASYDSASGTVSLTYEKKYSLYGVFGSMLNPEFSGTSTAGDTAELSFDDSFVWGAGANAVIVEKDGYQLFADGSYSATDDMDVNKVTINSTEYTKSDFVAGASATGKLEAWQVALGVTKNFDWIKPYAGVKYLDVKATGKVSVSGDSFEASVKNKDKVGVFTGVAITPMPGLELNVQGRFVDETAVMGSVSYKF